MFSNANDFKKNDFFFVFGCISENAPENILQCLTQRKNKIKHTPTPLEWTKNPPPSRQATSQPTPTHCESNPHQNQPKTHPTTHETHCTKQKIKLKINQTPSTPTHRQHHNSKMAIIKHKLQIW